MYLGKLLNIASLRSLMDQKYITCRHHPSLPLAILNYTNECMFQNFWPEEVQHCRGLVVQTSEFGRDVVPESTIVARPFHKFFGLNHTGQPEYAEENLPRVTQIATEKVDGWMGVQWNLQYAGQNVYGVASRGSFDSPGAQFASTKIQKLVRYGAVDEFPAGYTPVYEIIFKAGKIVIDYPFEGLVLLGLVNIETGEELPYPELEEIWQKIHRYSADGRPWIRLVNLYDPLADTKDKEGFVATYPRPGTWPIKVKVKFEEYKRLHKLITGVTPQQIWESVHDPMAIWTKNQVPDHFRAWAIKWRDELYQSFQKNLAIIMDQVQSVGLHMIDTGIDRNNRKALMEVLTRVCHEDASIAMSLLNGKIYEAHQAIWKKVRPVGRETEVFYREGQGE